MNQAQRDLLLYLPDQIIVVDTKKRDAWELRYDFTFEGSTTHWQAREGLESPFLVHKETSAFSKRDTAPGAFSAKVMLCSYSNFIFVRLILLFNIGGPR